MANWFLKRLCSSNVLIFWPVSSSFPEDFSQSLVANEVLSAPMSSGGGVWISPRHSKTVVSHSPSYRITSPVRSSPFAPREEATLEEQLLSHPWNMWM